MWYTRSVPQMGFYVQERRFGFYQRQKDTGRVRATVRHLPAVEVPRFIEDLREYSREQGITFHVDDRELDERIGPVLVESGCTPDVAEVFLAHAGGMPTPASETEDLSVEAVNADTIEEAVRTERKAFADSEAEPDAEELRRRLTLCRAEMGGQGRLLLARVAGSRLRSWGSTGRGPLRTPPRHARALSKTGHRQPAALGGPRGLAGARLPLDHHKRGREGAPGRSIPFVGLHRRGLLAQGIQEARRGQGARIVRTF